MFEKCSFIVSSNGDCERTFADELQYESVSLQNVFLSKILNNYFLAIGVGENSRSQGVSLSTHIITVKNYIYFKSVNC